MANKKYPPPIQQTAIGDGNVQIAGDDNVVHQEVNNYIPDQDETGEADRTKAENRLLNPDQGSSQTILGNDNIQVVGNNNFIQQVINFFKVDTEQQRALRNRQAMLGLVHKTWIQGVLEKSLYKEILIELGFDARPDAVVHPWDMQIQMPDHASRAFPAGSSITDVFNEMSGAMLILGEPGSGKTTMLLELARESILRAQRDDKQPIPVIFNLSSWTTKQTIKDWLIRELNHKYNAPQKVAQSWVTNGDLLLLLDGLDEVRLENREDCVKAINGFRVESGITTPIAVCSRVADYEGLKEKLNLSGAISIQPLTSEQIEEFFSKTGPELDGVRQMLDRDEVLQELAKQPLVLSILTLAYHGNMPALNNKEPLETIEARRRNLFDTYIQKMFDRVARTRNVLFCPDQTKTWLSWLARRMIDHNQTSFMIEQMQPTWLNNEDQVMTYRNTVSAIFFLIFITVMRINSAPEQQLQIAETAIIFTVAIYAWLNFSPKVYKLARGLFQAILNREIDNDDSPIRTVDILTFNFNKASVGFGIGGFTVAVYLLVQKWLPEPQIDVYSLLFLPIITSAMLGLNVQKLVRDTKPGQRLFLTARNSLVMFLLISLGIGLLYTLVENKITSGMTALYTASLLGMVFGFFYGGFTILQHSVLRLVMAITGLIPWRLIAFLDYCTERIFLRRVGSGYIFVHRLLMEHFAEMYKEGK